MPKQSERPTVPGQAYSHLSLPEQVDLARPLATALLVEGIDFNSRGTDNTFDRIAALAGVPFPMSLIEEKLNAQEDHEIGFALDATIYAALAVGIALGQCLTPNALNGGAR